MSKEFEEIVGIPESITINGVTYSVKDTPELLTFMQAVAKVEKTKLYSNFENLKAQIAKLSNVTVEAPQHQATDIQTYVDALRGTFITKEDLTTALRETVSEVVQPVLRATEQSRVDELKAYRDSLIQKNASVCIPELVKGNTKEEMEAALQESIRLRAAYPQTPPVGHVSDPLLQQQAQNMGDIPPTPAPVRPERQAIPSVPQRQSPEVSGPKDIKSMPMAQFASEREKLQQELNAIYGQ